MCITRHHAHHYLGFAETQWNLFLKLRASLTASGFWEEMNTTWACLDCELMPWSAKAQELLRSQYAAVGAAGNASLPQAVSALEQSAGRLTGEATESVEGLLTKYRDIQASVGKFVTAYRHYCWQVDSLDDLRLAPFHLMATEGQVHTHQNHLWHMGQLAKLCQHDPKFLWATRTQVVDVTNPDSEQAGIEWWEALTARGGEGMVVKPLDFIVRGKKGLVQPAVKCRGREYLRIIYGPDYTAEENLSRLRSRGLSGKRSLALREFALGIEGLERFVRREPLRRVHECGFGALALESEPVDPRL
jgi:protein phosphatase